MDKLKDYTDYIDRLVQQRGISLEEAVSLKITDEYFEYLMEQDNDVVDGTSDT